MIVPMSHFSAGWWVEVGIGTGMGLGEGNNFEDRSNSKEMGIVRKARKIIFLFMF